MIVLVLGLVLTAFTGIAAGQDSGGKVSTGPEGISTNTTNPEIISGYSALPALATAEFRIIDNFEINVDNDIIPSGTFSGRHWGDLSLKNTQDSSQTILGTISETMQGDSFVQPEFPENAIWNSSYIHWVFPPDFVLNENDSLSASYHTSTLKTVFNPVTLKRYVNKSIFLSDSYQFNSYEVNFEENTYDRYSGILKFEENLYSNSSILLDTFSTDLPLTDLKKGSYIHPITKQYVSEINFTLQNSSIQLHHPYYINFTAAIKLTNNAGSPVKCYPRVMFATSRLGPWQQGETSMTAIMPLPLLPAHVTCATATTNVSNVWRYQNISQLKLAFNQTAERIEKEKIGVVRTNKTWILDASGNGAYGAGDLTYTFGMAGDVPVTGDWTGTGTTRIGVVRSNTTWLLDASGDGKWGPGDLQFTFGKAGDVYVTGDWNNDRKTEIGVVRNNKTCLLDASGNGAYGVGDLTYTFGAAGDRYVTGDWNADGKTEIGVVRSNTTWLLDASGDGKWGPGDYQYTFGKAGDKYVTGKWS